MRCRHLVAFVLALGVVRAVPAHAQSERKVSVGGALLVSPLASVDFVSDGHGPAASSTRALGVHADIAYALAPYIGIGLGLRYAVIALEQTNDEQGHELSAPLSLVGSLGLGSGRALEGVIGLGYSMAIFPSYRNVTTDGGRMRASGPSGELMLGYVHPLSARLALTGHGGVHLAMLEMDNGDSYWMRSNGFIGTVFVRFGLRYR